MRVPKVVWAKSCRARSGICRRVQAVGVRQSTGSAPSHEVASVSGVGTLLDPRVGHNMRGGFCSFVGGTVGAVRDMVSHRL